MADTNKTSVLVISSHVVRGSVGNRAAVFALEAFGYPVWAVPTILLPWHPGHGPATRMVHDENAFASFMDDIANAPWIDEVGAVLTGYMAGPKQARIVAKAIRKIKTRNPNLIHVCDPVIGDIGGLYVGEDTANAIRDELLPICDLATPNRFELGWLSSLDTPVEMDACHALARSLGPRCVLVTSCGGLDQDRTGNLYVAGDTAMLASHQHISDPPNGPGDLTAAVFLAHLLDGLSDRETLELTTASVFEILQKSTLRNSNELMLESDVESLLDPKQKIAAQPLEGT
jgi:pyridoxine kinase